MTRSPETEAAPAGTLGVCALILLSSGPLGSQPGDGRPRTDRQPHSTTGRDERRCQATLHSRCRELGQLARGLSTGLGPLGLRLMCLTQNPSWMPLDQSVLAEVLGKVVSEFPCLSEVVSTQRGAGRARSEWAQLSPGLPVLLFLSESAHKRSFPLVTGAVLSQIFSI